MRPKILIIEDEPALRETLKEYLSDVYFPVTAGAGKEALKDMKDISFKAALVDLNLPDMSGIEIVEYIVERHPKTAVLVLTGDKAADTVKKAIACGADDYILKPVDSLQLHKRIEKALNRRLIAAVKAQNQ